MPKRIQIDLNGVSAVVVLLEEAAPRTCRALWQALEKPARTKGIHAKWAGRMILTYLEKENQVFDPTQIGQENATVFPQPGDIIWVWFPPGETNTNPPDGGWDVSIIYGPETRAFIPTGWQPLNVWAQVTEGLPALAAECAKLQLEGAREVVFRRLE